LEGLTDYIAQIPIRHDVVSSLILAGILQGILLIAVILSKRINRDHPLSVFAFYQILLLFPIVDHYLCYTGLMTKVLHLNDSTEVFGLLFGPVLFFLVRSVGDKTGIYIKRDWPHFVIPLLYLISQLGYLLQSPSVKLNSYLNGFHPDLQKPAIEADSFLIFSEWVKDSLHELIIFLLLFYLIYSTRYIFINKKKFKDFLSLKIQSNRFGFSKYIVLAYLVITIVVLFSFQIGERDEAEHYIFLVIASSFFFGSYFIMRASSHLAPAWAADKYDTSGMSEPSDELLLKINSAIEEDSFFLDPECTLKGLSKKLGMHSNYVSQAINQEYEQKFRDYINSRRISVAKERLLDPDFVLYTITAIGESVGFNSKSAFYSAFKKHTGVTPATYREKETKAG